MTITTITTPEKKKHIQRQERHDNNNKNIRKQKKPIQRQERHDHNKYNNYTKTTKQIKRQE